MLASLLYLPRYVLLRLEFKIVYFSLLMEPVNKLCMAHHRLPSLYYIIHTLHSGMWVLPGTKCLAVFLTESFISLCLLFITSSHEDVVEPLGSVVPGSLGLLASLLFSYLVARPHL